MPRPPSKNDARGTYRGRFAPSPTGPLHFGSLVAALGSYLQARSHGGQWLIRIEDLDSPRTVPGAAETILRTLEALGLHWDGPVLYQSSRTDAYAAALDALAANGAVYPCACTRREVETAGRYGPYGLIYPGTCRRGVPRGRRARALRLRVTDTRIAFQDRIQGPTMQNLACQVGDFVVRRADNLFAYQLAVVVDDGAQGITEVVRGSDLLESTPRQIYLFDLLGEAAPAFAHLPVAVDGAGAKLSKQTGARPLDPAHLEQSLTAALTFLGHRPPADLHQGPASELLSWGISHWDIDAVARRRTLRLNEMQQEGPTLRVDR